MENNDLNQNIENSLNIDKSLNLDQLNSNLDRTVNEVYNNSEADAEYVSVGNHNQNNFVIENLVTGNPGQVPTVDPSMIPKGDPIDLTDQEKKDRDFQYKAAVNNYFSTAQYSFHDPTQYAQHFKYNSGELSSQFYDRYVNRWDSTAYNIDFHPMKNNEANLNTHSSWFEDFTYALGGAGQLALAGFAGTFESLGRIIGEGDFTSDDPYISRTFSTVTAENYSSKNNIGSFINNLTMNFGYTLGIFGSIALENGFGALGAVQRLGKFSQAMKAYNAMKAVRGARTIDTAVDGAKVYSDNLKFLNKLENARKYFQGWNMQRLSESTIGRAVNPLSNVTRNYYNIINAGDDIAGLAATSRGFGAFYRDLRNINLAVAEARLEAGINKRDSFNKAYGQFYIDHGRLPNMEEMNSMVSTANAISWETSLMNTGIIYVTNKLAFDNILNPRRLNNIFNAKIRDITRIGDGQFGEVGKIVMEKGTGAVFKERGFRTWLQGWKTDPLAKSLSGTISYFKVNVLEGVQESLQEVIAQATREHYEKLYYSQPVRNGLINKALIGEGSTPMSTYGRKFLDQFSAEGGSIFASGFFMGFLSRGLASGINAIRTRSAKIYDPAGYKDYVDTKTEIAENLAERINKIGLKEFVDSGYFNAAVQGNTAFVQNNGDIKEGKDAEVQAMLEHVFFLKDNGILDMYIENFSSYQDLSTEEFMEAFPKIDKADIQKYKGKIPAIIERMRGVSKKIDKFDQKYKAPIDITQWESWMFDYEQAVLMDWSFREAKKQAVFYEQSYEDVNNRMISIMNSHYSERSANGLSKSDSDLILTIKDKAGMKSEISRLENEVNQITKVDTPEARESARAKQERLEELRSYYEQWEKFDQYFHRKRYKQAIRQNIRQGEITIDVEKADKKDYSKEYSEQEIKIAEKISANFIGPVSFDPKSLSKEDSEYYEQNKDKILELAYRMADDVLVQAEDAVLDQELGKMTAKKENELVLDLRKAYKRLISYLGGSDFVFDENVEKGFEYVLDFYKLSDESRDLVPLINFLNDPAGFMQVYEANMEWMRSLYEQKGEYVNEIIKQEFKDIESNGLLNYLADQGIFISNADFILLRDHGYYPTEFFDTKNQVNVTEDSPMYDTYKSKIDLYYQLQVLNETLLEGGKFREYTARKQKAQQQRDIQIAKEKEQFKEKYGITVEEFEKQKTKTVASDAELERQVKAYKSIKSKMAKATDPAEVSDLLNEIGLEKEQLDAVLEQFDTSAEKDIQKKIKAKEKKVNTDKNLSKEERATIKRNTAVQMVAAETILDGLIENAEQELTEVTVSEFDQSPEGKAYTAAVKKIEDEYQKIIDKIESEYTDEEKKPPVKKEKTDDTKEEKEKVKRQPISTGSVVVKFEDYDEELQQELTTAFEKYLTDELSKPADLRSINEKEFLLIRGNWLTTAPAKLIIDKYNQKKLASIPKTIDEVEVPTLKTLNIPQPLNDYTLFQVAQVIKALEQQRNEKLTDEERADLESDIKSLTKYLNERRNLSIPESSAQKGWLLFEEMILKKQNEIEPILDEDTGTVIGYKFKGAKATDPAPTRVTQYATELKDKMLNLPPWSYNAVKEEYLYTNPKTGKTEKRRGSLLNLFDSLDNAEDFMAALRREVLQGKFEVLNDTSKLNLLEDSLKKDYSIPNLQKTVNRLAFVESTVVGNTIDELARAALTLDTKTNTYVKPPKPDNMSDEAYEQLTGDKGILTELLDWAISGKYIFYTGDARVFDKTALNGVGIAGTMDILAFNTTTGEFHIIDIKTSKSFENMSEGKILQYRAQQSIYRNLVHNMTGQLPTKLSLLLIEADYDMAGNIKSVKRGGASYNKATIDKLTKEKQKLEKKKAATDDIKKIENQIKSIKNNPVVDIEYVQEVGLDVPLVKPTNIPSNLTFEPQSGNTSKTYNPYITAEVQVTFGQSPSLQELNKILNKMDEAKSVDELDTLQFEILQLGQKYPALGANISQVANKAYQDKIYALNNKLDKKSISKGNYVILNQGLDQLFNNDVGPNYIYVIDSVKGDEVKVKQIGHTRNQSQTFSISGLQKAFKPVTSTQAEEQIQITQEEKSLAKQSKENQKKFNEQSTVPKSEDVDTDNEANIFGEEPEDC